MKGSRSMKKIMISVTSAFMIFVMVLSVNVFQVAAFDKDLPTTVEIPSLLSLKDNPDAGKREIARAFDIGMDQGPKLYGKAQYVGPPKMGWNSWNAFWTQVNQWNIKGIADSFVRLGLDDVGYEYVVVDDGNFAGNSLWNQRATTRNPESGNSIEENLHKFPDGFKANVDYVHSLGLKYGMYGDVGTATCNGYHLGTWGYEDLDAMTYAKWGVDYIKYDTCNNPLEGIARRSYAPYLRSVTVSDSADFSTKVAASSGQLIGQARLRGGTGDAANDVYYIGTGPKMSGSTSVSGAAGSTGYLDQGQLILTVNVPADGNYSLGVEYAATANGATGYGRWLTIDVNGNGNRLVDQYVPATANATTFSTETFANIPLKAGENTLRFCNFGRMETAIYQYAAFADAMAKASAATDHEMVLSLCEWGNNFPWDWGYLMADSWRTTNDVMLVRAGGHSFWKSQYYDTGTNSNNSYSVTKCYNENVVLDEFASNERGWNDADMLVVGTVNMNHATGSNSVWPKGIDIYNKFNTADYKVGDLGPDDAVFVPGTTTPISVNSAYRNPNTISADRKYLSFEQEESHFNAWAIMNSVLMMGFDLRNYDKEDYSVQIVGNADVIALNQDPLGIQAKRIKIDNPDYAVYPDGASGTAASIQHLDALAKPLANGDMGLMFFNVDDEPRTITLTMDEIVNNKDKFMDKSLASKIVNKAGKHDGGKAFLAASSYTIQDLSARGTNANAIINEGPSREPYRGEIIQRTRNTVPTISPKKAPVTVTESGAYELSKFDSVAYVSSNTAPNRPTEYSSKVTYENGEFKVTLAPHASAIYRISYNEGFSFDREYLVTGDTITATATYNNTSNEDVNAFIVLARYDESGKLVDVAKSDTAVIGKNSMSSLAMSYYLPDGAEDDTLRAFFWDASSYTPLFGSISKKIYDYQPATKAALDKAIRKASEYDLNLYSLATGSILSSAIAGAQIVYENERASQSEVDAAVSAINTAIDGLADAPRVILSQRLAAARAINLDLYSQQSGARLTNAITAGQAVYDKPSATEAECETAITEINEAINGLASPMKTALGERLIVAKAISLSNYNLLTGRLLSDAITNAQLVLDNPLATEVMAETALTALNTAIDGLVAAPVDTDWSLLNYRIAFAEGMQDTEWTYDTWQVLLGAVAAAKALQPTADQAAINNATAAIEAAISALNPT